MFTQSSGRTNTHVAARCSHKQLRGAEQQVCDGERVPELDESHSAGVDCEQDEQRDRRLDPEDKIRYVAHGKLHGKGGGPEEEV